MERLEIIARYKDLIEAALDEEYLDKRGRIHIIRQDQELERAEDVEQGTLKFMMEVRSAQDRSQYLLYLPDPDVRERIHLKKDRRENSFDIIRTEAGFRV